MSKSFHRRSDFDDDEAAVNKFADRRQRRIQTINDKHAVIEKKEESDEKIHNDSKS